MNAPSLPAPRVRLRMTAGLSVVELLVAMTLGLFVLAALIQVLVSGKQTYRYAEAQSRIQENARFATQMLAAAARPTRSAGCRSSALEDAADSLSERSCALRVNSDQCDGDSAVRADAAVGYSASQSSSAAWLADLPHGDGSAYELVNDSWLRGDVLVTWGTVGDGTYMVSGAANTLGDARTGPVVIVAADAKLKSGALAMITDCEATDVFTITNSKDEKSPTSLSHAKSPSEGSATANSDGALSRAYNRVGTTLSPGTVIRARVFPFDLSVYYICCVNQTNGKMQTKDPLDASTEEGGTSTGDVANCDKDPDQYRPALCVWSATGGRQAMLMDVADMRVTYDGALNTAHGSAECKSGSKTRFSDMPTGVTTDAKWVAGCKYWGRVDTAQVRILVTASEAVRDKAAAPNPAATTSADLGFNMAADRRVYNIFNATVALRSRTPWFVAD